MGGGDDTETCPESDPETVMPIELSLECICHKMVKKMRVIKYRILRAETYLMEAGNGAVTSPESDSEAIGTVQKTLL